MSLMERTSVSTQLQSGCGILFDPLPPFFGGMIEADYVVDVEKKEGWMDGNHLMGR